MTEYFKRYRSFVASCLDDKDCDFAKLLDYHKEHIAFFQHERLIHLIVTVLFALCTVMTFIIRTMTKYTDEYIILDLTTRKA